MTVIKAFQGIRPNCELAKDISALPYDVFSVQEALKEIANRPLSFLRIDKPDIYQTHNLTPFDTYEKVKDIFEEMIAKKQFIQEEQEVMYLYELTQGGRCQTGLVCVASSEAYMANRIKKHENTLAAKEIDRIRHVEALNAQTGPIFLAFQAESTYYEYVDCIKHKAPLFDFVTEDQVRHRVFQVIDDNEINKFIELFNNVSSLYIADGHHRAAAAVKVANEKGTKYFLSVLFPHTELNIMSYHRVVRDLNGLTQEAFLASVAMKYNIESVDGLVQPQGRRQFGLFLQNKYYLLRLKDEFHIGDSSVDQLDVSILQNTILGPILGIHNPREDERIEFIGGIRGVEEIKKRVQGDMQVGFSLYPTSIEELFKVADEERLMPPKSTWFEPKLRSGLFIHPINHK